MLHVKIFSVQYILQHSRYRNKVMHKTSTVNPDCTFDRTSSWFSADPAVVLALLRNPEVCIVHHCELEQSIPLLHSFPNHYYLE